MKTFKQFSKQINENRENLMELDRELTAAGILAAKYGPKIVKGAKATARLVHNIAGKPFVRQNLKTGVKFGAPISQGGATPGMGALRMLARPVGRVTNALIGKEIFQGTQKALKSDKKPIEKAKDTAGELVKGSIFTKSKLGLPLYLAGPSIIKNPKGSLEFAKNVGRGAKRLGTDIGKAFINKVKQVRANNKAVPKSLPKAIKK